jgi:hypothetical protein
MYQHLGGERVEDIAIYYSLESKFNMSSNGRPAGNPDTSDTHTQSSMQVASRLIRSHLPFGVITKKSMMELGRFKVLILSNVHMMDQDECDQIRQWVQSGGKLIATGGSSLVTKQGKKLDDFMLSDVFGVSIVKEDWSDRKHYLSPTSSGGDIFPEFSELYPAFTSGIGFEVRAHESASVLATTTLPWPRQDNSRFSSIHSDPPWKKTLQPEIVQNRFGKGESIYCASLVENMENAGSAFVQLVRRLHADYRFEVDAPGCVEATLFRQEDRKRYLLSLLNFQQELPNIPISDIRCRLNLPDTIGVVRHLKDGAEITALRTGSSLEFTAPRLETLSLFELTWR